jgi:hypothetical protein
MLHTAHIQYIQCVASKVFAGDPSFGLSLPPVAPQFLGPIGAERGKKKQTVESSSTVALSVARRNQMHDKKADPFRTRNGFFASLIS